MRATKDFWLWKICYNFAYFDLWQYLCMNKDGIIFTDTAVFCFRMLAFAGIRVPCLDTFFSHQKTYLNKVACDVWSRKQAQMVKEIQESNRELVIAGDARCDSMGHRWLVLNFCTAWLCNQLATSSFPATNFITCSTMQCLQGIVWILQCKVWKLLIYRCGERQNTCSKVSPSKFYLVVFSICWREVNIETP